MGVSRRERLLLGAPQCLVIFSRLSEVSIALPWRPRLAVPARDQWSQGSDKGNEDISFHFLA